jgi:putative intracellular protease/amidase
MKGQVLKLFVITVAFLLLASACAAPPPPPTPAPPTATPVPPTPAPLDVVQDYQDAIGRYDVDTAMALFTDDATYRWGDYFTTSDKTMIRNWLEYGAALHLQTKVNDCKPVDANVACEWRFVHDCFGAEGAEGVGYDMGGTIAFTVKDGEISDYVLTANPDPEYNQWEPAFFEWLGDANPAESRSMTEAFNTLKFDRALGEHLVKLCKEHVASATADLTAPVKAWTDALNSGDVDAALAPFTDDVTFAVFEYFASNKDGLRGIFDWLAGLETKYQVTECQPKDGGVVCTMPVVDACIAGFGATDGLPTKMEFSFQGDGKISKVSGNLEGGEWDNYFAKWVMPGTSWMQANRAEESAKVNAADRREAGSIQTKLCKEYGESLKATPMAPEVTPLDIVQKYQDAVGRHDVETAMALFIDDAKYAWGDYFTTSDKTMIRNWLEYGVALNAQTTVNNCKLTDPTVTCESRWVNDCFGTGATGGHDIGGAIVFTVKDGKISNFAFTEKLVPEYSQWGELFFNWLADTYPAETILQTLNDKKFDGNFGQHLDKFCKEWGALKTTPTAAKAPAATGDQLKVVQAYHAAISSGDVDAALALLTDDAKLRGVYYGTGKEALPWIFDWLVGQETKYGPANCQRQDDQVVCTFTVSDACIAAYGAAGGLPQKGAYVIGQDSKIREATETIEGAKWDDLDKFVRLVSAWAATNRAGELPGDGMTRENAIALAKLCKEYAESLKATPVATGPMKPGENQVLLVAQEESRDMELMLTKEVAVMMDMLEKAGYNVVVASPSGRPITGGAATLKPHMKLADVKVDDYAGFIFPCMAANEDSPVPAAVEVAKMAAATGKPMAAQVVGATTLGAAGILKGKQIGWVEPPGDHVPGAIYKGNGVVQDGNIVTSGSCPFGAKMAGSKDGTPELTQKFIDLLASSR